jgi:hypothetical protein
MTMCVIALETVAHPTGQPEILFVVRAAVCRWHEVIDLQRPKHVSLRTLAISTPIPGLRADTLS